jgi:hypothetical protein
MPKQKPVPMFSAIEAARRGIQRVYDPKWANPLDHIKIDIIDGKIGPWLHLYAPFNKECNGRDPVDILITEVDPRAECFYAYTGPLPDSDEYKAAVARFNGVLKQ